MRSVRRNDKLQIPAILAILACCAPLVACHRVPRTAPPRATDHIAVPAQRSVFAVPIGADLGELTAALDRRVHATLWTIDKPDQVCAASKRVTVLFAKVKTPTIKCRLVGTVTRGAISISGSGRDIVIAMPLHATISARDIGGVLKQETAQADARVRARMRLDLAPDWTPRATLAIDYDWIDDPHVDFLGRRIEFTSKADAKLKGVIADLQRTLPRELAGLHLRDRAADAWRSAFTSLELNRADPPVWMRITPQALAYGGYAITNRRLTLQLGMTAITETFVGPRPADPPATPLPPLGRLDRDGGEVLFAIPVIADYAELEPVLAHALAKRAQRPFEVPAIGPVNARFGKVAVYGTTGGKIAVGLTFSASRPGRAESHGTVWLTARPVNAADSRQIGFADLAVAGVTESTGTSLLLKLVNAPGLSGTIADALTQNFSRDYAKLLTKISGAIADRRQGDLLIRAHITGIRTGRILAAGQGVYLPVAGRGTASIELAPQANGVVRR